MSMKKVYSCIYEIVILSGIFELGLGKYDVNKFIKYSHGNQWWFGFSEFQNVSNKNNSIVEFIKISRYFQINFLKYHCKSPNFAMTRCHKLYLEWMSVPSTLSSTSIGISFIIAVSDAKWVSGFFFRFRG